MRKLLKTAPAAWFLRALFGALGFAWLAAGPPQAQQPAAIQSRCADVNGVKLHYLVAGQGPAVILLHGYAQTSHNGGRLSPSSPRRIR